MVLLDYRKIDKFFVIKDFKTSELALVCLLLSVVNVPSLVLKYEKGGFIYSSKTLSVLTLVDPKCRI
jgi:hypothetical protein